MYSLCCRSNSMKTINLNIAGESFDVMFDGQRVTSTEFPDQPINYTAPCGTRITQEMLVQICKTKTIEKNP